MLQVPNFDCGPACFITELATQSAATLSHGAYLCSVIIGGCVLWVGLLIGRWVVKKSGFRSRRR